MENAKIMKQIINSKKTEQLTTGLWAFAGTYGLCYLGRIAGIPHASFSIISLPIFIILFGMTTWVQKKLSELADIKQRRHRVLYAAGISYLFSVAMIMGYQLQTFGMTDGGVKGKFLILLRAAGLSIALFPFCSSFFGWIEKIVSGSKNSIDAKIWKSKTVFAVSALLIFLVLIPVWLAYYPITMSYDFHRQVNEASNGFAYFWPYQPIAHTWIIWLFLQLGYLIGDLEAGMAGMALLHMLAYSLTTAYACTMLYRIIKKRWVVPAGILFFGVFPLNSVLVLCTTKDVLFSILFLLFILLMTERFFFCQGKMKFVWDILVVFEGCIMVQFRNNCLYALLVFSILWLLCAAKKEKLHILLLCVLLIAGSKGTSALIKTAIGTQLELSKREMFSVPIMQFARAGYFHENELDEDTFQLINTYVAAEYWDAYNPPISDVLKSNTGGTFTDIFEEQSVQPLKDWFRLAKQFPNEFLDAFLELTRGYWFLDDRSNVECLGYGVEGRMGTIYTYNSSAITDGPEIMHESKFPWLEEQLEKIVSGNSYYNWPVISILFRVSFYFWGLILTFVSSIYMRKKKSAILCLYPLMYMATLLLGPVVQIRYIFPIMLTLPVLAASLVLPGKDNIAYTTGETDAAA